MLKEAVNNAIKYSEADLISVNVDFDESVFKIAVVDNGKGFDEAEVKKGNGLTNIKKRAKEIGGAFILYSKPGEGCLISIEIKIT